MHDGCQDRGWPDLQFLINGLQELIVLRHIVKRAQQKGIRRKLFVSEPAFDRSVILLCARWYLAYNLSLRNLEEMMAERSISVDHASVHRWVVRYSPELLERFNLRKRSVSRKWHVDETYIKVRANGNISIEPSTATVTPLSSGSASGATSPLPNAFWPEH